MARRVPVLDARFFVTAVLTQRESGGNLSEVLDNLASVMRERFKVKRQIRVISAHGRLSAWVLSWLAPALAGVLFLMSPDFMRILWEDPIGLQSGDGGRRAAAHSGPSSSPAWSRSSTDMDPAILLFMFGAIFLVDRHARPGWSLWFFTDPQFAQRRLSQICAEGAPDGAAIAVSLVGYDVSDVGQAVPRRSCPKSPKDMGRIERMLAVRRLLRAVAGDAVRDRAADRCRLIIGGAVIYSFGTASSTLIFAGLAAALGYYSPGPLAGPGHREARRRRSATACPTPSTC